MIPSKKVSKVKPVLQITSIAELHVLRSKTVKHLNPSCPPSVRQQVSMRIQEIDARIQQLSNINTVTTDINSIQLDDRVSSMGAGPSKSPRRNIRWNSGSSNTTNGSESSPVSPISVNMQTADPSEDLSSSPTSPLSPISSKARILSQPLVTSLPKHRSKHAVQPMSLAETLQREHEEYEKALAHRERQQARRAEKEALKPLSSLSAHAQGLTEEEKKARILAFMNYKGDSDDEDEDDEDIEIDGAFGDFESTSDEEDRMSEDGDQVYMNLLSEIIQVDPRGIS